MTGANIFAGSNHGKSATSPKLHRQPDRGVDLESEHLISEQGNDEDRNNNEGTIDKVSIHLRKDVKRRLEVTKTEHPLWIRISAALFYVTSSTVITMANKIVLTSYS